MNFTDMKQLNLFTDNKPLKGFTKTTLRNRDKKIITSRATKIQQRLDAQLQLIQVMKENTTAGERSIKHFTKHASQIGVIIY